MRVDLVPVFHVNLKICEFFNVDLDERGYCQIRISPKPSSEFTTTFEFDEQQKKIQKPERSSRDNEAELLPSCILNKVGVSKTVEITFVDEKINIEELFKLTVRIHSPDHVCMVKYLFIDVEIWYMDRYRPPNVDLFQKLSGRCLRIPLDPTRMIAAARSLYFESTNIAAITMRSFSSLVGIETSLKEAPPDKSQIKSQRAKNTHSAAIHALLYSKRSIERFIAKYSSLTNVVVCPPKVSDIQKEMKGAREALEQDPAPYQRLKLDILRFSTKLDFIYSQMLELFENSKVLTIKLLTIYDKQRRNVLREAFFYQERLKDEIRLHGIIDRIELFNIVSRSKYLKRLPKITLFCAEIDSPGEVCSVIFEEVFTKPLSSDNMLVLSESMTQVQPSTSKVSDSSQPSTSSAPSKPFIYARTAKSFRERASNKLKFMKPRRRSLDHQSPTKLLKDSSPRSLTFTTDNLIEAKNAENVGEESVSYLERCSAAGNQEETQIFSTMMLSAEETIAALSTSPSVDQIQTIKIADEIQEDHPQDMMDTYEFIREKESMKSKLVSEMGYDGYMYSEKSNLGVPIPTFTPLTSSYIEATEKESSMNDMLSKPVMLHLVVFVHGLEGSPDDLQTYKNCLRQVVESHVNSNHSENENAESWKFEFMMSKSNLNSTWDAFKNMSANLLEEIMTKLEQTTIEYDRISFVAHSLGGLIVRHMLGMEMGELIKRKFLSKLYTFMTINTPHLGLAYVGKHVNFGVALVQLWKRSTSLDQMSFKDTSKVDESFIYELSRNNSFSKFVNILVIGNPQDQIVPCNSALIMPNKQSLKDSSVFGVHYRQIIANLISSIQNSERIENFVRYSCIHQISTAKANHITGRAAHIAAVEDLVFVEKIFSISAIKYFM